MESLFSVLLVDDDAAFRRRLAQRLREEPGLVVVGEAGDGETALAAIEALRPEVVVLDLVLPGRDGLGVLAALRRKAERPQVMIVSAWDDERLMSEAYRLGARYYVVKPFDLGLLCRRLRELCGAAVRPAHSRLTIRAGQQLDRLGIPRHFKGYRYLVEAVALAVQEPELVNRVTRGLYQRVAQRFATTPQRVERAIRHAIETAATRGNLAAFHARFSYTMDRERGKPTNASFIAELANCIRYEGENRLEAGRGG